MAVRPRIHVCLWFGWLKDKFGVSWQVVPTALLHMLDDEKSPKSQRAFAAMMDMKKLDIAALERAYDSVRS